MDQDRHNDVFASSPASQVFSLPPDDAAQYIQADKQYVWHPFTPMRQWTEKADLDGCIIQAAEGFELIDLQGRRYIDGTGSLWCNLHGHRVPQIDAAIRMQLDRVAHSTLLGFGSLPSIDLARRLVEIMPPCMSGLRKVFFSDSGAAAIEIALKMAFQYYRNLGQADRRKFIAFREGYHGDTIGAVSLGGVETFHHLFKPLLFETTFVDSPNEYHQPEGGRAGQGVLEQIEAALLAGKGQYAGVFIEPLIQAAGGMLTMPAGFLAKLRELTRRHDVLLIADEVATGFCRTGKLFACEHEQVGPDILCLGKGLTGGYLPVAATMATQKVFDAFLGESLPGSDGGDRHVADPKGGSAPSQSPARTFYHGHTFTGNALGCAAAVASVDLIFSSGMLEALPVRVELMRSKLAQLANHPHVGDIRQCGLMAGIELVENRDGPYFPSPQSRPDEGSDSQKNRVRPYFRDKPFDPAVRIGAAVCEHARRHGLIIRPLDDIIVLMPAPAMDLPTLERMMDAAIVSVQEYFRTTGTDERR